MPAPNPWTIYDFETALENAAKDVLRYFLTQASKTTPIYTSADSDSMESPRIEIDASISSAVPQWGAQGQGHNPKQVPLARYFELKITVVVTKPDEDLGVLRGVVRWGLSAGAKGFNTTNLPYLQILELYDVTGFESVRDDDKEQQGADVTFGGQFAVRNDAWPSVA